MKARKNPLLGLVLVVTLIEQLWPAQRRPLLARGHLLDLCYLLFYALLVVPLIVLLGAGFGDLLARLGPRCRTRTCAGPTGGRAGSSSAPPITASTTRRPDGWTLTSAPSCRSGMRSHAGRCFPSGARTVGIFGFKLTFSSGLAGTVLAVEAAGVIMLALTGWLQLRRGSRS